MTAATSTYNARHAPSPNLTITVGTSGPSFPGARPTKAAVDPSLSSGPAALVVLGAFAMIVALAFIGAGRATHGHQDPDDLDANRWS